MSSTGDGGSIGELLQIDWLQGAIVILLPSLPRVMQLRSPDDCLACPLITNKAVVYPLYMRHQVVPARGKSGQVNF